MIWDFSILFVDRNTNHVADVFLKWKKREIKIEITCRYNKVGFFIGFQLKVRLFWSRCQSQWATGVCIETNACPSEFSHRTSNPWACHFGTMNRFMDTGRHCYHSMSLDTNSKRRLYCQFAKKNELHCRTQCKSNELVILLVLFSIDRLGLNGAFSIRYVSLKWFIFYKFAHETNSFVRWITPSCAWLQAIKKF